MNKIRVADVIKKDDVLKWKPRNNILIASPMGTGKSYFCKNILYDIAKDVNGKILMLIHRSNCVEQFKYEIEADGKSDVIEVITYQSLEYSVLIYHNINLLYVMNFIISLTTAVSIIRQPFHLI